MHGFNIYHRKDGRWEGRISKKGKGKRTFLYFFGKTKDAVQNKMMIEYEKNINQNCSLTVEELYHEWRLEMLNRVKISTASNYEMKIKKHILPKLGEKNISCVQPSDIYAFITEKQSANLSERYIADILTLLKSIFKYGVRMYLIRNPFENLMLPKKKCSEISILDTRDQEHLQHYLFQNANLTNMGIALSLSTGLRIGELCALQWKDINLKKRTLTVNKTIQRIQTANGCTKTKLVMMEPKSESSKRRIPIPDFMVEYMCQFEGKTLDYVLSCRQKPVEPRTLQYRFSKVLKSVNLPSVHFHALRHMFATNCIKLGFDIKALSEILRHSNVQITMNQYAHTSFEQKQTYMNRLKLF